MAVVVNIHCIHSHTLLLSTAHTPSQQQHKSTQQVNGSRGEDLDNFLLMRQQVENSRLPSELKRSALIGGPHWDQLLLHVNRTVKVSWCVCVRVLVSECK